MNLGHFVAPEVRFLNKQGDNQSGEYRNQPERTPNLYNKINDLVMDYNTTLFIFILWL